MMHEMLSGRGSVSVTPEEALVRAGTELKNTLKTCLWLQRSYQYLTSAAPFGIALKQKFAGVFSFDIQ